MMGKASIARDLETVFPQAVPDISVWPLFPKQFAVGSRTLDSYVVVPEGRVRLLMDIISRLDGSHSLAAIAAENLREGRAIDIEGLYERLRDAGLLKGSKRLGELQGMTIPLFEIPVRSAFEISQRVSVMLFPSLMVLTGIALVAGIVFFAAAPKHWILLGIGRIVQPPFMLWSLAIFGYVLTILWHELCHALTAVRYGLIPSTLSVVGYLALVPLFVLKIPGIYLLPPSQRIRIWGAGIWGSLALAGIVMTTSSVFQLSLTWQQYLARIALANLIVAVSNLFPFLPTDGYFILSTLFRQPNIRARAWREFKEVIRFRRSTSGLLMIYIAISGLTILSMCVLNIFRLYRLARFSIAGFICVCGLVLLLIVRGRVLRRSHS